MGDDTYQRRSAINAIPFTRQSTSEIPKNISDVLNKLGSWMETASALAAHTYMSKRSEKRWPYIVPTASEIQIALPSKAATHSTVVAETITSSVSSQMDQTIMARTKNARTTLAPAFLPLCERGSASASGASSSIVITAAISYATPSLSCSNFVTDMFAPIGIATTRPTRTLWHSNGLWRCSTI